VFEQENNRVFGVKNDVGDLVFIRFAFFRFSVFASRENTYVHCYLLSFLQGLLIGN
jgi:hypothetical protein